MSDDLTRLTDEERATLRSVLHEFKSRACDDGCSDGTYAAVESILAARTTALIEHAERERDELADKLGAERMAFALEVRAHRRLRAAVTGLADEWEGSEDDCADSLRALLTDEGDNQ